MTTALARRDIFTSNLPDREKTALARVLARVGGSTGGLARVRQTVAATGDVVGEVVEAGVVGGLVGLARAKGYATVGLPASWWAHADGSPVLSAPVEAVAAAIGFGFAIWDPMSSKAPMARRGAAVALGIFAAAQTEKWLAGGGAGGGPAMMGDFGAERGPVVDTIAAAAAAMGGTPRGFR
jgi:hypothetical protein